MKDCIRKFDTWRSRDLADEDIRYVFMDGWYPKVCLGGRRERVPVLVTLGVRANGERVVLEMRLAGEESAASWTEVVASLAARQSRPAGLGCRRWESGPHACAPVALAWDPDPPVYPA